MTKRPLRHHEKALWERVAKTVEPLRKPDRRIEPPPPPAPKVKPPATADAAPGQNKSAPKKGADKPPSAAGRAPTKSRGLPDLDRKTRRKLARGNLTIEARIDLHGMTEAQAHGELIRFLDRSFRDGRRHVLVITGKGTGGEGRGVLRRAVPHWLGGKELSRLVVSFGPAHHPHGGDGALYVRLRSRR
ncbi:MAG: Smr/MutS family protein [Devosia sp.]